MNSALILKKTKQLANLLLRVAIYIRRDDFRRRLEKWSLELLEDVALENFEKSVRTIKVLETLINLGQVIYEIEPVNASIVIKELSTVNSEIRQRYLPDIIAELPNTLPNYDNPANNSAMVSEQDVDNYENPNENGASAIMRQSAILKKIRQNLEGGCQIKDLIEEFPSVSERTLRNDLQKLVSQGLIDRIGSSGPGTAYIIR